VLLLMKKMNLINMRHNSIVSFLKSIISFLAEFFPLWIFSEDETVLSTRLKRPDPAQYILPAMVSVFLGFSGQWNMAGAQGCDPSFRNCPGDIVVNVQPGTCGNNVSWTAPVMTAPCPGYTVTSNHEPGNFFNAGTTTVTYFSWEGTEKKDSCKFNVIVIDNQKPVVLTKNANLYIGQSGTAILRAADIDNGSYDNCSLILVPSRTVFTCSDVGQTIAVMLRGSDPSGNSSASGALVTVYDTVRPVIMTREFTLTLDNNGTGIIQASDIDNGTYDNCGPVTLSVTPSVFSCADQGDRTVRFTTTDIHGNTASRDVFISVRSSLKIHSISLSNCDAVGTYSLFNLNVSGGAGNYTYFWDCLDDNVKPFVQEIPYYPYVSFANTSHKVTPFFNNNIPNGSYTIRLTVTDGNGCRDSADMLIIKSGPVYGNVNFRKSVACEGSVVTYTVNPDPVATFDWEVENGTILSSVPYSNSVEVRWNLGVTRGVVRATLNKTNLVGEPCAATVIDSVSIDLIQPPVFNNPVNIACMGSEEIYTLTAPYQFYEWSVTGGVITEGGSDNNFVRVRWNEAPAGKVEVIVSTPAGCSSSAFVDVIINNLEGSVVSLTDISCNGAANGMVTVAAVEGSGLAPYEYSLDGGTYQSSGSFVNIGPGPHIVTIRDAHSCTFDVGFNITQPVILVASVNKSDVSCFGGSDGSVSVAGSGGTAPYEYSLNGGPFRTSGSFPGLPAGSYTVQVRDANLCTFVQKVMIMQPDAVSASAEVTIPVNCHGGTATVAITGSGGTPPLSYTFNGSVSTTGVFPGISAGVYEWSVTDANGCGPFRGTLEVTEPPQLSGSASVTGAIDCHGGTAIVTLTGSGGTSPLTYTFNGISNDTGIFTGIPAGNGYSWSITDANNCGPVSGVINVTEPPPINGAASVTTVIACHGGTATVRLTGGGGTAPLTYTFNGISNDTGIFTGIPAGSAYTWIITDSRGCGPVTGTLDVTEPAVITGSAMILVPVQCNSGTATVQLTGGGGTAPLTYTFNGISNETGIFTGISAGNGYIWSITDANNCSPVTGVTDISGPPAISAAASVATEIACHGGTVTVVITGSGGTPPLSYTFNGSVSATGVFPGISAGVYEWSVTDANGCGPFRGTLEVTEPPQLSGSASVTGAIACHGGTATVTLTGSGGTSPLTYTFNGISNDTGIFTGIPAGSGYSWSITDARGCDPITGTVDISEPEVINASVSITEPIICYGGTTTVIITGSGGTAPLTYTFNGISNRTGIFAGIPAGSDYHWSVTDTYLCTPAAGTLDITEPPEYRAEITFITNVSVSGGNDGSVTVEASGGTAPYLFRLNSGSYQPSGSFSDLTAGSYSVTVRDAALCETVLTVRITEPVVPLSGTLVSKEDILCFGASTGMITVSGTDGLAPYEYSLNGGDFRSSGIFTDLSAGSYIVTIRDAQPEEYHIMVILDEPATAVSVETRVINNICHGSNRGIAIAIADGGTGPYEFSWNSLPVQKNDTASGLAAGTYTVTVDDANGCRVTAFAVLTDPPPLTLGVITTDADCPDTYEGSAEVTVSGGNAPYNAFWEDGNTSFSRTEMLPGTYRLIVTDADGCVAQEDIVIGYSGTFGCLEIPQVITPNNDGFNDEWRIRNIEMYPDAEVLVYTRWGKLVYRSRNISADPWDGRFNGRLMPTDSYHYILYLNDGSRPRTGVISIIR
jgi:gliding motility-associated-like protein